MNGIVIAVIVGVIVGIGSTVLTASVLQDDSEDFDLQKIRYINEIGSCVELKEEYQLIKQYDSVLEHSNLYLKAVEDRAQEIIPGPTYCDLDE